MRFGEASRPRYSETQLTRLAWALVLAAVAFYVGLILGVATYTPGVDRASTTILCFLSLAGWAAFPFLAGWQAHRLEKTTALWVAISLLASPVGQVVVCWMLFAATRRRCSVLREVESHNALAATRLAS